MGSDTSMVIYLVLFRDLLIPRGGRTRAVVCHASLHLTSRHDRDSQIASSSSKSDVDPHNPFCFLVDDESPNISCNGPVDQRQWRGRTPSCPTVS